MNTTNKSEKMQRGSIYFFPLVNTESTTRWIPDFLFANAFVENCISNFSFLDPWKLLITTITISQDSGKDDIKINTLISSSKLIFPKLSWLIIILNSFIWFVIDPPLDICRLNNLCIKYTLFTANNFSYIFDNVFNRSDVVLSLMKLNATFLDNVSQINSKACRFLSFHCSVVIVFGFTQIEVHGNLSGTDNF